MITSFQSPIHVYSLFFKLCVRNHNCCLHLHIPEQ